MFVHLKPTPDHRREVAQHLIDHAEHQFSTQDDGLVVHVDDYASIPFELTEGGSVDGRPVTAVESKPKRRSTRKSTSRRTAQKRATRPEKTSGDRDGDGDTDGAEGPGDGGSDG